MSQEITCFNAYDVRGRIPEQLNEEVAYRIGRAYAAFLKPKEVVVGYDIRLSSQKICQALINGLTDAGVNVSNIGQCGTEEIYFATSHLNMGGGIVVTASHNPKEFNGMKFVREDSKPISSDTGLKEIKALAELNEFRLAEKKGETTTVDVKQAYIEHLISYIDIPSLKPLKVVCNAGNGGAGLAIDLLEEHLPIEFIKIYHEADGNFPNGVPNPLLEENRQPTVDAIIEHQADLGIAWDGDFDRCFFFDERGTYIEGYYIVGLLAETFLKKQPGEKIVHDPRLIWNTVEVVKQFGGEPILCKSGHTFIKEKMRNMDAIYGGEMSAHHYFRDFFYCDSGMIPWLLITELLSVSGRKFSSLVENRKQAFPASGEINRKVEDVTKVIEKVQSIYSDVALSVDFTDGLSMDMGEWRFNLRKSNTEPFIRLNVESLANQALMETKTQEILAMF